MADYAPQTIEFADTAPAIAEGSAEVDGTPAEVWAVLIDNERWPEWFGGGVTKVVTTSAERTGVGSTREVHLGKGRPMRFAERFIAWDEGERWAFTVVTGPPTFKSLVERCLIEPISDTRTRVTYRMAFEPRGFLKPFVGLLRGQLDKAIARGMGGLAKEVVKRRIAG
jgi:uncharacterized protein YndB with AHSA1/START domain